MEKKHFTPNVTYDNAIKNEEKGSLKALLISIIGSDPTFATTEYEEALAYIEDTSKKLNGHSINLFERYDTQNGEYEKARECWNEEYYGMLLVWFRDNFSSERLEIIKQVGKVVYKDKTTLGKVKFNNRKTETQKSVGIEKHQSTVNKKISGLETPKGNWRIIAGGAGIGIVIVMIIYLILHK